MPARMYPVTFGSFKSFVSLVIKKPENSIIARLRMDAGSPCIPKNSKINLLASGFSLMLRLPAV